MDSALRLHPGQQELTPAQQAEARRFAQARIAAQLATSPVDEPETERLLQQAYVAAGLPPPTRIAWLDGPLHLMAVRAPEMVLARVGDSVGTRVGASVWTSVWHSAWESVGASVGASVWTSVGASVQASLAASAGTSVIDSVQAYHDAPWLAVSHFFDTYLAPNALHALARFNERVSGYWLGQDTAFLVRRPALLARDQEGRLHSARGKSLEYPDGWGISAWHGVRVPEQVILAPETLKREDFQSVPNLEVRRVIQERMGKRFVR